MKLSWKKHHDSNYGFQTAIECKNLFINRFGSKALRYVSDIMDNVTIANQCVINLWTGTTKYFRVEFKTQNGNKLVGRITITTLKNVDDYEISDIDDTSNEEFKQVINQWEKSYKAISYQNQLKKCGFDDDDTTIYNVNIDVFDNYKQISTKTLEGTLKDIFDDYVTFNDRMRYINGTYWKWSDEQIQQLYSMFINKFNGNYYLANAVKRGVIID